MNRGERGAAPNHSLLYLQLVFALFAGMLNVPLDLLGEWMVGGAPAAAVSYTQFHLISAVVFAVITFAVWRWIVPRLTGVLVLRLLVQAMLGIMLFGYGLALSFVLWTHLAAVSPGMAQRFGATPALASLIVICGATLYLMLGGLSLESASHEQRRLRELALGAELEALRSQLNHHFLFNSLNVIAEAAAVQPPRAEKLILQLAGVLRYSLGAGRARLAPLSEELAAVGSYLELERARSGDRISVRTDIAPDVGGIHVPPLLIQPLVENAVAHGLLNGTCAGTITIAAWRSGEVLYIRVTDDGVGLQSRRIGRQGVGLSNLRGRLRAFYGEGASLSLHRKAGGDTVAEVSLALTERSATRRPRRGVVWRAFFGYVGSLLSAAALWAGIAAAGLGIGWSLLAAEVVEIAYLLAASAAEETKTFDLALVLFLFIGEVAYVTRLPGAYIRYAPACLLASCAAIAFLPQLFGAEPFTTYWMRRGYPAWLQKSPTFMRVSKHLAFFWGAGFALLSAAAVRRPAAADFIAVLCAIALIGVLAPLSKFYPRLFIRWIGLRTDTAELFILGLPCLFDRVRAGKTRLSAQFVVSGGEPGSYYVEIAEGRCAGGQGSLAEPNLTIYCGGDSFTSVAEGVLSPERAAAEGLLRYTGSAAGFSAFFHCFRLASERASSASGAEIEGDKVYAAGRR